MPSRLLVVSFIQAGLRQVRAEQARQATS